MKIADYARVNLTGKVGQVIWVEGDQVTLRFDGGQEVTLSKSEVRYFS